MRKITSYPIRRLEDLYVMASNGEGGSLRFGHLASLRVRQGGPDLYVYYTYVYIYIYMYSIMRTHTHVRTYITMHGVSACALWPSVSTLCTLFGISDLVFIYLLFNSVCLSFASLFIFHE